MDIHFNSYKIKYNLLTHYMKPLRESQHIRKLNIFINLDDIFHTLHKPLIDKEFQVCGKNAARQLVSNVFNIIGHYRNWCIKEHIYPYIYAIYSSATQRFRNQLYIPKYRSHFFDINRDTNGNFYFINDAIINGHPIFHVIAKYIEDVYMIDSKHLEPSMIPLYLSKKNDSADWNLLVSRDSYDLQYAYRDKWSLIIPKGEDSLLITRKNLWDYIAIRERVYEVPEDLHYDYNLFVIAKSIVGDRYRSIPRLKSVGWKTLFNYMSIVNASQSNLEPEIISQQRKRMLELISNKKIDTDVINKNIDATDIDYQVGAMLDTDKVMIDTQLEDMVDYPSLQQMNTELFREFPLNLTFLCNRVNGPIW